MPGVLGREIRRLQPGRYQLLDQLAGQGMAVLFASSDLEEILGIADRVLVMHEGRLTGQLVRNEFSEEAIMKLATGIVLQSEEAC